MDWNPSQYSWVMSIPFLLIILTISTIAIKQALFIGIIAFGFGWGVRWVWEKLVDRRER